MPLPCLLSRGTNASALRSRIAAQTNITGRNSLSRYRSSNPNQKPACSVAEHGKRNAHTSQNFGASLAHGKSTTRKCYYGAGSSFLESADNLLGEGPRLSHEARIEFSSNLLADSKCRLESSEADLEEVRDAIRKAHDEAACCAEKFDDYRMLRLCLAGALQAAGEIDKTVIELLSLLKAQDLDCPTEVAIRGMLVRCRVWGGISHADLKLHVSSWDKLLTESGQFHAEDVGIELEFLACASEIMDNTDIKNGALENLHHRLSLSLKRATDQGHHWLRCCCLAWRSRVNTLRSQWGEVVEDCTEALQLNAFAAADLELNYKSGRSFFGREPFCVNDKWSCLRMRTEAYQEMGSQAASDADRKLMQDLVAPAANDNNLVRKEDPPEVAEWRRTSEQRHAIRRRKKFRVERTFALPTRS